MIKIANNLQKLADHKADLTANDVVNMDTTGGLLADWTSPGPALGTWGARRAGRASAMSDAVGLEPSMLLKHPAKSRIGFTLGGLLGGAGLGALGGTLLDGDQGPNMLIGGGLGALTGALGGTVLGTILSRKRMQAVNDAVNAAETLNPVNEDSLGIGLFGGPYNLSRVESEQAINDSGGDKQKALAALLASSNNQNSGGPVGAHLADGFLGGIGLGPLGSLTHGVIHNQKAKAKRRANPKNKG